MSSESRSRGSSGQRPSIQVDWLFYGPKLAQVALTVGADDVDGISADDDVSQGPRVPRSRKSGATSARRAEPAERDGRFDLLAR